MNFHNFFILRKIPLICNYTNFYCFGAGKSTVMSTTDGLGPYIFCQKKEKSRPMKEEMDGKIFMFLQSWHFLFIVDMFKVLFPIYTMIWPVNIYVSSHEKGF